MNKHVKISLIVLVTVVMLLALTVPGLAKKPDNSFLLDFYMDDVDWDNFTYKGTFTSTGAIEDEGDAYGHFSPVWGSSKGTMILQSSDDGDRIVISFTAPAERPCTSGPFRIHPSQNTGDYEGMWGQGKITICRDDGSDDTYGWLEGFAVYP